MEKGVSKKEKIENRLVRKIQKEKISDEKGKREHKNDKERRKKQARRGKEYVRKKKGKWTGERDKKGKK